MDSSRDEMIAKKHQKLCGCGSDATCPICGSEMAKMLADSYKKAKAKQAELDKKRKQREKNKKKLQKK